MNILLLKVVFYLVVHLDALKISLLRQELSSTTHSSVVVDQALEKNRLFFFLAIDLGW